MAASKRTATAELERLQTVVADLRVEAAAAEAKADALNEAQSKWIVPGQERGDDAA